MSNPNDHPLMPIARSFASMPANLNPLRNPSARARLPAHLQPHVDAIAANPTLAAVASGASTPSGATPGPSGGSGASYSTATQLSLAPNQSQFKRLPDVRHQVCGMAPAVFGGAGSLAGKFTPQVRFKGNRLVIPSNTHAGTTISNMLVGTKPQYAAASTEPFDMFEEQSTGGVWDLDVCEIGQVIQMSITATAATTVFACIIGEALDGKPYPMLRSPLKRIGFTQNVLASATTSVTITPQVRFKTRKLILDDSTASNFTIVSFNVGITPQFISGDPVPASAFTELSQDVWLDCDEAYIGNVITLTVTNNDGGAAHVFGGALLGDVDPRDLASAYGYTG